MLPVQVLLGASNMSSSEVFHEELQKILPTKLLGWLFSKSVRNVEQKWTRMMLIDRVFDDWEGTITWLLVWHAADLHLKPKRAEQQD